jgi:hypothetical protein
VKKTRKPVQIDWDELEDAFDWNDPESHAYLDLETGEVVQWSELLDEEERSEITERIDDDPDRYAVIEPPSSGEAWRWMAAFAATVADPGLRRLLDLALGGKGAFGRFKRAMDDHPAERERWFAFRDERLHEAIEAWLAELEIEIADPPPWRTA